MSVIVKPLEDERWAAEIRDEPEYIVALEMAPPRLEEYAKRGSWLIVAFAIWSITDRVEVTKAIECAKRRGGAFQLGLRPVDNLEELRSWIDGLASDWAQNPVIVEAVEQAGRTTVSIRSDATATPV